MARALPTGTVTLLFTDIEGSTRHWEAQRAAMPHVLRRHDELVRTAIETNGGYVFKTVGDEFCAVFWRASDAIAAALDAQRALAGEDWRAVGGLTVRMAAHSGATDERGGDYFGPPVNRVARLLAVAHGGQIVVSNATAQLLRGVMPEATGLCDLGEHGLKDLVEPERVWQLIAPGLPANFPALRSLQSLPNNLPRQLTALIGRDDVVSAVEALVKEHPLVTLVGTGGVGKTRVALQVGANLLDGSGDGVWLVELAPLNEPSLLAGTIASTLGVREQPERPALETLLQYLKRKRLLLVVDNCEHLIEEAAKIADAVVRGSPEVKLLVTSRESLRLDGERVYPMPTLAVPPSDSLRAGEALQYGAVALFVQRAMAADANFALTDESAPIVAEICRRLDGIALAIELAAARVKVLKPSQLARRLDERFRILTGGSRTALPRQQTMRALIDWSYDLLSPSERTLFRRVSIFAGGWTLEAAETICADEQLAALDILELSSSLVEKSLIVAGLGEDDPRYGLLESMRAYAAEKLDETGERPLLARRRATWVAQYANRIEAVLREMGIERWLPQAEPEIENARAAMGWAFGEGGDAVLGARIAVGLAHAWNSGERRHWLETALSCIDERRDPSIAARAWRLRARTLAGARTVESAERALAIEGGLTDARDIAQSLAEKAYGLAQMGRLDEAAHASDDAMRMLEERGLGRTHSYAYALSARAFVANTGCDAGAARALYAKSLALAQALGDRRSAGVACRNLAEVEFAAGDARRALELVDESKLMIADDLDEELVVAAANSAAYQLAVGRLEDAKTSARKALLLGHRSGMAQFTSVAIGHVAAVAALSNDVSRAARLLGYVDAWYRAEECRREPTEQRVYEILLTALRERLTAAEIEEHSAQGALLSEDQAVAEALAV